MMSGSNTLVQPYKLSELATLYRVSRQTMRTWIKPFQQLIGEKKGMYFSIAQVEIIFQKLEPPSALCHGETVKTEKKKREKKYAGVRCMNQYVRIIYKNNR